MKNKILLITVMFCGLFTSSIHAEVYKYRDDDGKIQYSDKPFKFKQKNIRDEQIHKLKTETAAEQLNQNDFIGKWKLNAVKLDQGIQVGEEEVWNFSANKSFQTEKLKELGRSANFRVKEGILQTNETGQWVSYEIITLNGKQMVLRNNARGIEYHLHRVVENETENKTGLVLYRRDQVAKINTIFQCAEKIQVDMLKEERELNAKQMIRSLGFVEYNEELYKTSLQFYQQDRIYKETYMPRIAQELSRCEADLSAVSHFKYLQ